MDDRHASHEPRASAEPALHASGQTWKLLVGFVVMLAGFVTAACGVLDPGSAAGLELAWTGVGIGAAALAVTCWSVRCPSCGTRWLWTALQHQSARVWIEWLLAQSVCPRCGKAPSGRRCRD